MLDCLGCYHTACNIRCAGQTNAAPCTGQNFKAGLSMDAKAMTADVQSGHTQVRQQVCTAALAALLPDRKWGGRAGRGVACCCCCRPQGICMQQADAQVTAQGALLVSCEVTECCCKPSNQLPPATSAHSTHLAHSCCHAPVNMGQDWVY